MGKRSLLNIIWRKKMSKTCNEQYFNTIEEIENSGEDYNRKYAIEELSKVMGREDAESFCDNLESKWDMQVDYLVEQERESQDK